jgi:hypothetical protein
MKTPEQHAQQIHHRHGDGRFKRPLDPTGPDHDDQDGAGED